MIYHIITEDSWNEQLNVDSVIASSLLTEGFIHCCTKQQVDGVLFRYFQGQTGLLLLELDERKLNPDLKFEKSTNDELFPHVYGPINRDSIVKVEVLRFP